MNSPYFSSLTYTSPNVHELQTMASVQIKTDPNENLDSYLSECRSASHDLMKSVQVVLVTLGELGVLVIRRGSRSDPLPTENDPVRYDVAPAYSATYYPVPAKPDCGITCVSGKISCFLSFLELRGFYFKFW